MRKASRKLSIWVLAIICSFSAFQWAAASDSSSIILKNLTLTSKAATSVSLKWGSLTSTAFEVDIQQSQDNTTWSSSVTASEVTPSTTSATVTGLEPSEQYYFRLLITTKTGAIGVSNTVITTLPGQAITDLAVTAGSALKTAVLTWTPAKNASGVLVQYSDDNGKNWSKASYGSLSPSAGTVTVNKLEAGKKYLFRLNVSGGKNAGISNVVSYETSTVTLDDLTVVNVGSNAVNLRWTAPVRATSVKVQKKLSTSSTWSTAASPSKTASAARVTGLTPNATYQFRLLVTGGDNAGTSNVVEVTTSGLELASFELTEKTSTTATLKWSRVTGATSLKIEQSVDGGASWATSETETVLKPTSTTAKVIHLEPGTAYKLRLVVVGGQYANSTNVVSVTLPGLPVNDLAVAAGSSPNTAVLTWTPVEDARQILVQYSDDKGKSWTKASYGSLAADAGTVTVGKLVAGTEYWFRINVVGGKKAGPSNVVTYEASSVSLDDLEVVNVGSNVVNLRWTAPVGAKTIQVQKKLAKSSTWSTAASPSKTAKTARVTGLTPNTAYQFRLLVTGGANAGTSNVVDVTTPGLEVSSFEVKEKTFSTVTLKWSKTTGATSLSIEQSTDGGNTWTASATAGDLKPTATTATVVDLEPATAYKFRLLVTGGQYANSNNVISVTTSAQPIQDLEASNATGSTVVLTWSATNATKYIVYQSTDGGKGWKTAKTSETLGSGSTSATVIGLSPGTTYVFRLYANNGTNAGYSNTTDSITTESSPVDDLRVQGRIGPQSIPLKWTAPKNATKVVLEYWPTDDPTSVKNTTLSKTAASRTVSGLAPNTSYTFHLVVTGGGNAGISNELTVSTAASPITTFRAKSKKATEITFSWTKAIDADAITIQQYVARVGWVDATVEDIIDPNDTSATVTGLSADTTYEFRLIVDGGQNAGISNTIEVTTSRS
ncbi:fibronectin type III domain-containing protein [Cohnella thermotolerans]|uniref:fibronectin type III domain-containing protein n=1 Tax=Cohnella thermotolerans TaxID=329858 RepID=UPI000419F762|nr:fibronectin type III domain-containing protein [Cohnella thermotolerans]